MTKTQSQEERAIALVSILAICVYQSQKVQLHTKNKVLTVKIHGLDDDMLDKLQQLSRKYK